MLDFANKIHREDLSTPFFVEAIVFSKEVSFIQRNEDSEK